jgi:hypothetical protein
MLDEGEGSLGEVAFEEAKTGCQILDIEFISRPLPPELGTFTRTAP